MSAVVLTSSPLAAQETLTLDAAVQRALASNYTIKIQSFAVPMAEANVDAARGRFDPHAFMSYEDRTQNNPSGRDPQTGGALPVSVTGQTILAAGVSGELPLGLIYELSGSTVNDVGDFPEFSGQGSNDFDRYNSGVNGSLRLPLLRGFGRSATLTTIRIARTDLDISEWEFRAAVINTITDVVYAYNNVLFAHASLRSARRSRELAAGLHAENERRHQVGSMSDYDVLSARARVATREEGILIAERFVREAENRIRQLTSDNTSARLLREAFVLAPPPAPTEVLVDLEADLPVALEKRPDYQQARLALARNEYSFQFYRNQLLPAVELFGRYGYNGSGLSAGASRDEVSDRTYPTYSTGVSVSIPLTSTAERARYRSARLARAQSELALRQLEQDIVVNLGNAAGQIETSWQRLLATRTSRDLSQQALDAEVKKLRAGTGRTFDVLQLQEILSNDEVREARAMSDYRSALAEYDRQLGRTLETFHIDLAESSSAGGAK